MSNGLLIDGELHDLSSYGLTCIPPASHGGPAWARIQPGDGGARKTKWTRQLIFHTTKGIYPQRLLKGAGKGGRDRVVADFWAEDPDHSAAQIVIDNDGSVVCLCDLLHIAAYHATVSNDFSVGVEIYQEAGGGIYEAAMQSALELAVALCDLLRIPRQYTADRYGGAPLARMAQGGADCVGIFGHRSNTGRRGRGDPGDMFFTGLGLAGFEAWKYDEYEDLEICRRRQRKLRDLGEPIEIDGLCGPRTLAAAQKHFGSWAAVG